jgi:hypothetical protein
MRGALDKWILILFQLQSTGTKQASGNVSRSDSSRSEEILGVESFWLQSLQNSSCGTVLAILIRKNYLQE